MFASWSRSGATELVVLLWSLTCTACLSTTVPGEGVVLGNSPFQGVSPPDYLPFPVEDLRKLSVAGIAALQSDATVPLYRHYDSELATSQTLSIFLRATRYAELPIVGAAYENAGEPHLRELLFGAEYRYNLGIDDDRSADHPVYSFGAEVALVNVNYVVSVSSLARAGLLDEEFTLAGLPVTYVVCNSVDSASGSVVDFEDFSRSRIRYQRDRPASALDGRVVGVRPLARNRSYPRLSRFGMPLKVIRGDLSGPNQQIVNAAEWASLSRARSDELVLVDTKRRIAYMTLPDSDSLLFVLRGADWSLHYEEYLANSKRPEELNCMLFLNGELRALGVKEGVPAIVAPKSRDRRPLEGDPTLADGDFVFYRPGEDFFLVQLAGPWRGSSRPVVSFVR